jgi:arylsulfatase
MEPNTLAAVLADAGYHCLNVGWRNMHPRRKLYGFHNVIPHDLRDGDDDYQDWLRAKLGPHMNEYGHGVDANGWTAAPWHLEDRFHSTTWTMDVTFDQMEKADPTKPMFMWCSHLRPHSPYDPPQSFWDMYIDREMPEIPQGDWCAHHDIPNPGLEITAWHGRLTENEYRRMRAGYMGLVSHIDFQIGRLLATRSMKIRERLNNSIILFTADHGDMQGDHYLMRKTYAYEGSARIPFVVKYPRGMDLPTGTFEDVVGLQDVMPTLLEAAGVDIPDSVTGRSVFDAVRGNPWREFFHGEHSPCYDNEEAMHYLTDGKEKYIWFPATERELLFDLAEDRHELHDFSSDRPDSVVRWRNRLIDLLGERGDGFSDGRRLLRVEDWPPEAKT